MTVLQLPTSRTAPLSAPPEPFHTAEWIVAHVFLGGVSKAWVLKHCPREQLSRKVVRYHEGRVRRWLAERQLAGAA